MIWFDDFPMLMESWTWSDAWSRLWLPFNEHAMPLGRISTWILVQLAGSPTWVPFAVAAQGPLAVLIGMWLVFLFVRREMDQEYLALLALIVFGVTTIYFETVCWFASSFSVLALDTLFLALLAAQRWRLTGSWYHLALSALWSALAPGWFAAGILAGPMAALYLLPREDRQTWRHWPCALVPLAGSLAFLAVSLPRTADHIMHLEHYAGRTTLEAFNPVQGGINTARSLVDNLLLGNFGVSGIALPRWLTFPGLCLLAVAGLWWWQQAKSRRLLTLGLGLILVSYWLVYSARAEWSYDTQLCTWTRYNLLPQLGLALYIVGGLQGRLDRHSKDSPARQWKLEIGLAMALIAVLLAVNFPRAFFLMHPYDPAQQEMLQRVEDMDRRCRENHISAETARMALDKLPVPYWDENANGWIFLRGSQDPCVLDVAEARRLLQP
jgi:hypothetical protein